jgi:hypothetical protein
VDVAPGWQPLLAELERRIEELDPDAQMSVSFDEQGVVRLDCAPCVPEMKLLLREYEDYMLSRCELCGGTGRVHGGAILTVRCEDCG